MKKTCKPSESEFRPQKEKNGGLIGALSNETPFLAVFLIYAFYSWLAIAWFTQYIAVPLVLWAGLIFVAKIVKSKGTFLKQNIFGLLWCILYGITILLNRHYSPIMEQVRSLVWLFIFCVIIYSSSAFEHKINRNLQVLSWVTRVFTFLASVFSLYTYYDRWLPWLEMPDHSYALVGLLNNRLFGIYIDPNFGALFATLSIYFSLYYFLKEKRKIWQTFFNVVNIIVQILYIGLSYSRTGLLIAITTGILYIIGYVVTAVKQKTYKTNVLVRKIIVRIVLFTLIVLMIWKPIWDMDRAKSLGYVLFDIPIEDQTDLTNRETSDKQKDNSTDSRRAAKIAALLEQENRADTENSGNERLILMKEGVELLIHKPIFGVGDRNIKAAAKEFMPDTLLAVGKVPHNAFIFLFLASGLVGGGLVLIWLIQSAIMF